ncbi:hypothetical protein ONE63_010945 [Megalurothrips usitatus]|uniref:Uncharacterized protein n=1 Tax=Megalurothrips usitatus TaxID=439358 RepID=A0AAV7XLZ7_9NEOP|nr:hypothetical protein ONE63_010945 [Megalurothrips usitatus]
MEKIARTLLLPTAGSFIEVQDRLVSPVWHDTTNNKKLDVSCIFSWAGEAFYASAVPCFRTPYHQQSRR